MRTLTEITEQLSQVDLKKLSDADILAIMRQIPEVGLHGFHLFRGQRILRCRTNLKEFPNHWKGEKDISYLPDAAKADYGRASLRGNAMFYGCMGRHKDFEASRMLAIHEVNGMMHDPTFDMEMEEYAVVGNWHVLHPLEVISVVQAEELHSKNDMLSQEFKQYMSNLDGTKVDKEGSLVFTSFIAKEFCKQVAAPEEYKITAAFSHWAVEKGMHGVAYPSAKAMGDTDAFNVALTPLAIEENCKLQAAYAYRLIKEEEKSLIPYPFLGDTDIQASFHWKDPGYLPRLDMIKEQVRRQRQLELPAAKTAKKQ